MKRSTDDKISISIAMSRVVVEALLSKGLITEKDLENALTTVAHENDLDASITKAVWGLLLSLPGDSEPGSKPGQ